MKRAILRGLLAMLVLLLLVYVGDYCSLRYQIPHGRPQFGQITVDTLYAIHEKNGKTEYELGGPNPVSIRCFPTSVVVPVGMPVATPRDASILDYAI